MVHISWNECSRIKARLSPTNQCTWTHCEWNSNNTKAANHLAGDARLPGKWMRTTSPFTVTQKLNNNTKTSPLAAPICSVFFFFYWKFPKHSWNSTDVTLTIDENEGYDAREWESLAAHTQPPSLHTIENLKKKKKIRVAFERKNRTKLDLVKYNEMETPDDLKGLATMPLRHARYL